MVLLATGNDLVLVETQMSIPDNGTPNLYSRHVDPFFFDVRRAHVPDDLVDWEKTYRNPSDNNPALLEPAQVEKCLKSDGNSKETAKEQNDNPAIAQDEQLLKNDEYAKETNKKLANANPKGRTGLTGLSKDEFLPDLGKNKILHLVVIRNCRNSSSTTKQGS